MMMFLLFIIQRKTTKDTTWKTAHKSNSAKIFSEQCVLGKTKPTCQNSTIFETFQKWAKNQGDVLARGPSIVCLHTCMQPYKFMKKVSYTLYT